MVAYQSTYNRDLNYQLLAKLQPKSSGIPFNFDLYPGAANCMGLSTDSGVAANYFGLSSGDSYPPGAKTFYWGQDWAGAGLGAQPSTGGYDPAKSGGMIKTGTLAGPLGTTSGDRGVGNCVVSHTTGASSMSYSRTWTSDQLTTIYQVGIYSSYRVPTGVGSRRYLLWVQKLPTPRVVAPGDVFTITIVISL